MVKVEADGTITVMQNQIYYLTEDELKTIIGNLETVTDDTGLTSQYDLRYHRRSNADGSQVFFFSDTIVERNSLNAQILYSCVIGLGAIGLFFLVSMRHNALVWRLLLKNVGGSLSSLALSICGCSLACAVRRGIRLRASLQTSPSVLPLVSEKGSHPLSHR